MHDLKNRPEKNWKMEAVEPNTTLNGPPMSLLNTPAPSKTSHTRTNSSSNYLNQTYGEKSRTPFGFSPICHPPSYPKPSNLPDFVSPERSLPSTPLPWNSDAPLSPTGQVADPFRGRANFPSFRDAFPRVSDTGEREHQRKEKNFDDSVDEVKDFQSPERSIQVKAELFPFRVSRRGWDHHQRLVSLYYNSHDDQKDLHDFWCHKNENPSPCPLRRVPQVLYDPETNSFPIPLAVTRTPNRLAKINPSHTSSNPSMKGNHNLGSGPKPSAPIPLTPRTPFSPIPFSTLNIQSVAKSSISSSRGLLGKWERRSFGKNSNFSARILHGGIGGRRETNKVVVVIKSARKRSLRSAMKHSRLPQNPLKKVVYVPPRTCGQPPRHPPRHPKLTKLSSQTTIKRPVDRQHNDHFSSYHVHVPSTSSRGTSTLKMSAKSPPYLKVGLPRPRTLFSSPELHTNPVPVFKTSRSPQESTCEIEGFSSRCDRASRTRSRSRSRSHHPAFTTVSNASSPLVSPIGAASIEVPSEWLNYQKRRAGIVSSLEVSDVDGEETPAVDLRMINANLNP